MPGFRKIACLAMVLPALLSACSATTYQTYTRPGTSETTVSKDQAACSIEANKLFPAANFPTTYPSGFYNSGYYGGGWGLGVTYVGSTDVNAGMRNQHRRDCMRVKGYAPVTYPICTTDQLGGKSYARATGAPAPAPNICAAPQSNAAPVLIDLSRPL